MTDPTVRIEPSPRWLRGFVGGESIVDSKRVLLVYGLRRRPLYFFPAQDVRMDLLRPVESADGTQHWTLTAAGRTIADVGWSSAEKPDLRDYLTFEWKKLDRWYEEDEEVFAHPRNPYHRVDVLHSSRQVKVQLDGETIAESQRPCLLFETGMVTRYYLPKVDVRLDLLEPSSTTSQCAYKGNAVYWSVRVGDRVYEDVVWSYPFPMADCAKIQNLLAFYNEKVELYVDGARWQAPVV